MSQLLSISHFKVENSFAQSLQSLCIIFTGKRICCNPQFRECSRFYERAQKLGFLLILSVLQISPKWQSGENAVLIFLVLQSFWFVRVHPVSKFSSQETRILGGPGVFVARKPKRPVTHQQLSSTNLLRDLSFPSFPPLSNNLSLFDWKFLGAIACKSFGNLAQFNLNFRWSQCWSNVIYEQSQ